MSVAALVRRPYLAALAAAAVALVVALPSIANGFVYDDVWIVERNDVVHRLGALGELLRAPYWPEEHGAVMWRPVALTGYAVQWALGDGRPLVFHVVSILLYGAVSGLVALLAGQLFGAGIGLLAGVLFAVHPVHVEVTANVVGQAELIAALGYVSALLVALGRSRATRGGRRAWLLAAVFACYALALGGKEHVVTLPGALLVIWWLVGREQGAGFGRLLRREWPVLAGVVALTAVYLLLRAEFATAVTEAGGVAKVFDERSALGRGIVMLPVSLQWLLLLFVPIWLSGDYSIQHLVPQPAFGVTHAAALLVWIALAILVWRRRHQLPAVAAGCGLFVVLISVVSSLVVPLQVLVAERFLFLPSIGWAVAVAGLVAAGWARPAPAFRRGLVMVTGAFTLLLAARSAQRATVWRSNEIFYVQLLRDAPRSYRSHWAMGSHAFSRGDSVLGERELQTAIALNPDHPRLLEHLGRIYAASERYEPAIPLLQRAMELDSTRQPAALTLSLALARTGRAAEGLAVLDAAAKIHGEIPGVLVTRGEVLKRAGQPLAALQALDRMIGEEPDLWRVRVMAAEAAALAGRCADALDRLQAVFPAVPDARRAEVEALRSWVANGNAPCK